jgi:hypothetical protein
MKEGRFFHIPDHRTDLEQLWASGQPLDLADLPDWILPSEAGLYRYLGAISCKTLAPSERATYLAELEEVDHAGVIIDEDRADPCGQRLYVMKEKEYLWSIGIYVGDSPFRLGPANGIRNPVLTGEVVTDVPADFVADPFMLLVGSTWHMFFEVFNRASGKGEIGLATSRDGLSWAYRQIVLAESFHLSYPFVFAWEGDYYLVPESYQAGSIRLYQAREFPTRWEFLGSLLEGTYLVDTSLLHHKGRWWLFTETDPDGKNDTLRLFHADALLGPWVEHPQSPVVQGNPLAARPAGRVLAADGKVIRFAQGCYPFYGTDIRAFVITRLTTTDYKEHEAEGGPVLQGSGAGWNACGMHHLDAHPTREGRWLACVDGWADGKGSARAGQRRQPHERRTPGQHHHQQLQLRAVPPGCH